MNLTFNITIEDIELEVSGEYTHLPFQYITEEVVKDLSEFDIHLIECAGEFNKIDITNLLPLFEDKIYPICFDKARELYLDRLSKNE